MLPFIEEERRAPDLRSSQEYGNLYLMTLFVLVLHVSRTVLGFIFQNQFSLCYASFCIFCIIVCVYFHAAFLRNKPMMMMMMMIAPTGWLVGV